MSDITQTAAVIVLALTNIYTIFKLKNHVKTSLRLWLAKRRNQPIKLVTFFGLDNTVKYTTAVPDTETKTITVFGEKYQYDPKSILYSPEYQVQSVAIREGTQGIIDTTKWAPGDIDPRLFTAALKIAKERGREEARKDNEQYKKLLYIALAGIAITILVGILTYQRVGDIGTLIGTITQLIPKPVILT